MGNKQDGGREMNAKELARYIDHTVLKPDATEAQIRQLCAEAVEWGFASVCVNPAWVRLCLNLLTGTGVKVCTVVGFPLGANTAATKANEAMDAVGRGAHEVDMVINVGALKSRNQGVVAHDIRAVRDSIGPQAVLKVIIETCLLTNDEKVLACRIAKENGADFVKTSTGFSTGGATFKDIQLMRQTVGSEMGVKASGGVKTYRDAMTMIEAGATRLGCSAGVAIMKEAAAQAS